MALGDMSEKQLLGLTAGVVGAILLVMAGILLWTYLRFKGLQDDITAKNAEVVALKAQADKLKDAKERFDSASETFFKTLKRVPEGENATELDAQISEQAASAKLKVLKIEQIKEKATRGRPQKTTGKLKPIKIHVEAAGTFNAFGQFLNNIERNMERFVEVTGFSIVAYEDGLAPGKGPHEITLDLVTYRYEGRSTSSAAKQAANTR